MRVDYRITEFIREFREQHGNIDRRKIKIMLDAYCTEFNITPISTSLIGKIIRRKHFFSHIPAPKRKRLLFSRQRTKRSPKVTKSGYLELDSITVYVNNQRFLFITVMDVYTKIAWARLVPSLSAKQATLTLETFIARTQYTIHTVQTDNGSEFLGTFHTYLETKQIKHIFSYPRSPRVNGYIERFNRTIQEEFILRCDEVYYADESIIITKLNQYLDWYNTKRPHMALNYLSPQQFVQTYIPESG